jgi:DNA-binding response OmpR family regulator
MLDAGADAWVPNALVEVQLSMLLRTLVRRTRGRWHARAPVRAELDPHTHRVVLGSSVRQLRRREFELLTYLMSRVGHWHSERRILREVFDQHPNTCRRPSAERTPLVRVQVHALRRALGHAAGCVQGGRGKGYRFVWEPLTAAQGGGSQ